MRDFWKLYKRQFRDYPSVFEDAADAVKNFTFAVFALTLPVTFPFIYPFVVLYLKLKPKGK